MSSVLKLDRYNEKKEITFELKFQMSLTTRQRFEMMFKKTEEMRELLEKSGHRKAFEIIKRTQS
jgi:adenylate cyclase class IV